MTEIRQALEIPLTLCDKGSIVTDSYEKYKKTWSILHNYDNPRSGGGTPARDAVFKNPDDINFFLGRYREGLRKDGFSWSSFGRLREGGQQQLAESLSEIDAIAPSGAAVYPTAEDRSAVLLLELLHRLPFLNTPVAAAILWTEYLSKSGVAIPDFGAGGLGLIPLTIIAARADKPEVMRIVRALLSTATSHTETEF